MILDGLPTSHGVSDRKNRTSAWRNRSSFSSKHLIVSHCDAKLTLDDTADKHCYAWQGFGTRQTGESDLQFWQQLHARIPQRIPTSPLI
jgi:hypothetical protein